MGLLDQHKSPLHPFSNPVISHNDMLHSCMIHGVFARVYYTLTVTIKRHTPFDAIQAPE